MKISRVIPMFILLVLFSCASEETPVVDAIDDEIVEDNDDGQDDGDEDNSDTNDDGTDVSLSLTEAFPQVSLQQPVDFQSPDDGTNRIFVVERRGKIKVFPNESSVSGTTTFLDLDGAISTGGEQGVLGLAFHPNYSSNGFFYVSYTAGDGSSVISKFNVSSTDINLADSTSESVLLRVPQPFGNHNGGQVAFGSDGYLYISIGDGGGSGDPSNGGQNRATLLGSILRINVDATDDGLNYAIPTDNPFVNDSNVRDEIYAYGLRNPWRMSFDTQTGDLWTGDVGQNEIEEIDLIESGGNYGWNLFEGTKCFSGDCDDTGLTAPVFEYTQENGDRSITGGYVYRGLVNTSLQGKYVYGDFASGRIWALSTDGSDNKLLVESNLNISSFGTDHAEELYVISYDGQIYKFMED